MCNLAALAVTFWVAAVVDVRGTIAFYNVQHAREVTGHGAPLDPYYINDLGPAAIPALDEFLVTAKFLPQETLRMFSLTRNELAARVTSGRPSGWQEWTWRSDRLRAYLLQHPSSPDIAPSID